MFGLKLNHVSLPNANDIFKCNFFNKEVKISTEMSLRFFTTEAPIVSIGLYSGLAQATTHHLN